jgi:hypothetical protein
VGFALFQLTWNNILLWYIYILPCATGFFSRCRASFSDSTSSDAPTPVLSSFNYSLADVSFFTNVICFFFVVLFVLSDCLHDDYSLFLMYSPATRMLVAISTFRQTSSFISSLISYSPSYIYSFQCSAKIVINYVAVYVLMFILVGIVIPCLKLLGK